MLTLIVTPGRHLKSVNQGYALPNADDARLGARALFRDADLASFLARCAALPGWAGDLRMVVVDAEGNPLRVDARALTPDEQAAEALAAAAARREAARAQVNAADIGAMVQAAQAAATVEALRAQVVSLARLAGRLAEAQGLTPTVEAGE